MTEIDFDVRTFANLLDTMPENQPMSDAMVSDLEEEWYSSQREHMCSWFREQVDTDAGTHTRKEPNHSARTTYQRLSDGPAMIWLAEVLGVDEGLIATAATEVEAEPETRSHCGIIRRYIPWELLADKAAALISERNITLEGADREDGGSEAGARDERGSGEPAESQEAGAGEADAASQSQFQSQAADLHAANELEQEPAEAADDEPESEDAEAEESETERSEAEEAEAEDAAAEESGPEDSEGESEADGSDDAQGDSTTARGRDEAEDRASGEKAEATARAEAAAKAAAARLSERAHELRSHTGDYCSSCRDLWRAVSRLARVTWVWFKDKTS